MAAKFFYPVIHCIDPYEMNGIAHALHNTKIATKNNADGAFLIGHTLSWGDLCRIYDSVRKQFPKLFIGINFLDTASREDWTQLAFAVKQCPGLNALWIDSTPNTRLAIDSEIQIFSGVAFKYRNPDLSGGGLKDACIHTQRLGHCITTSGNETGMPPSIEKLQTIRSIIGTDEPLTVASGVSAQNVESILSIADSVLVASSISEPRKEFGGGDCLIPEKVDELANLVLSCAYLNHPV